MSEVKPQSVSAYNIGGERPVVCIMGPTAAGKTAAAMRAYEQLPVALISVDSAQVYRHMDIGTGKLSAAEQLRYPHALIDIMDPEQIYSAAIFVEDVTAVLQAAWSAQQVPVLVGGTGLYFHALLKGLSPLPQADAALRARIAAQALEQGWAAMHAELAELDPPTAARLHPNDAQRIQRAIEICMLSGEPMSALLKRAPGAGLQAQVLSLVVAPASRASLHARIERRFAQMLELGLLEEVSALRYRAGMHAALPSMRSVGYRQAWAVLDGRLPASELHERGVIATRQLARRQLTWLRAQPATAWFDSDDATHVQQIVERIRSWLGR